MRASMLVLTLLACPVALADLFTAQVAYSKGDYEHAFKDYRDIAELGQPIAQYNLAIMYAKGQGVRQSDINAYAWATLSAEGGYANGRTLADQLRPMLAPGSEQIATDIAAPYRRAALESRLMPKIEDDQGTAQQCKMDKVAEPVYPPQAANTGVQGAVLVEYAVTPDGTGRNPRVVYAMPAGVFEEATRWSILHSRFPARASGERAIHCHLMYHYTAQNQKVTSYPGLGRFVEDTRKKAETGDAGAEFLYGMLLAGLPQLGHSDTQALPWFLRAAQKGQRQAQYAVGASLLFGHGCHCEETKAEVWLRLAAEADDSDAQVTLAEYALRGAPDTAGAEKAKVWLERAAAAGNHDGTLYLSALLASAPFEKLRDPPRALALLDKVRKALAGDPIEFEIRAAAQAAMGQFDKAIDTERRAVSNAHGLNWDLAPLNERLARYQSRQPWYGDLLTL